MAEDKSHADAWPLLTALRATDLPLRVLSALVLAPAAIAVAWLGGPIFVAFWCAVAIVIFIEWTWITVPRDRVLVQGAGAITFAIAAAVLTRHSVPSTLIVFGAGLMLCLVFATGARLWAVAGLIYAGALLGAVTILRLDAQLGFTAIVFLFGVVWATDIVGYFVGKFVGGPKLWPAVSPNKTWSGASGSLVAGATTALAIAGVAELPNPAIMVALGLVLSIVSQIGDLAESALKRLFGIKDASHIIPGHGGVMDRLDGFAAAAVAAAALGVARGGLDGAAQGFLLW